MAGREIGGHPSPGPISVLRERLTCGLEEQAGDDALDRANMLLEQVHRFLPPERRDDADLFRERLVRSSVAFVREGEGAVEKHLRATGASHLLVNMLCPPVEETDDQYLTERFEELRDGLYDLERIDVSNPSLDARLLSIFEGLLELAGALAIYDNGPQ
ncbi:MAG: hypothetical protein ISF22_07730 [Methanomassiliicoccus sp.]|nr:hypothetical protein [Methanomassiliicoccus sp.]